jgi:hypothetical protein
MIMQYRLDGRRISNAAPCTEVWRELQILLNGGKFLTTDKNVLEAQAMLSAI